jgi:VWFA-related protein
MQKQTAMKYVRAIQACHSQAITFQFLFFMIAILLCAVQGAGAHGVAIQARGKAAQQETFKVKTELVEVRAVVTDRKGRPIENLGKDDFELLVNRKPRTFDHFSFARIEDAPALPAAAGAATGVAESKSVRARLTEPPVRTVLLYVDNLHLSFSSLVQTKQALRKFVDERLTEQDRVSLVTSGWSLGIAEQFTRDRALLRSAIDRISPGPTERPSFFTPYLAACIERRESAALSLGIALLRLEDGIELDPDSMRLMAQSRARQILSEASYKRRATLLTLKELVAMITDLPGQRMVVLFSDGFTMNDRFGDMQTDEVDAVTTRAARAGVSIYSIDAKGLQPPAIADASMSGGAAGPLLESYMRASETDQQDGMHALAADTGGEMYRNTNDLGGALGQIFDANKSYYVLAYYLENDGKAPRFSRISVRVKGHPEYVVRTPKGFYSEPSVAQLAETDTTRAQHVMRALRAPLPRSELMVSASAEYVETDDREDQITLIVLIDGDDLQYREQDQRHMMELEVVTTVFDASGKQVLGFANAAHGNLTSDRLALARSNGYKYTKRLSLKPGVYQARVAVIDTGTERFGTAFAWIEVPDLAHSRFALSSLILYDMPGANSAISGGTGEAGGQSRMYQNMRLFPAGTECAYFFRIQKGSKSAKDVALQYRMELIRSGQTIVEQDWQPAIAAARDSKGITITGHMSLAGLPSGIYELRLTARELQSKRLYQRTAFLGIESGVSQGSDRKICSKTSTLNESRTHAGALDSIFVAIFFI